MIGCKVREQTANKQRVQIRIIALLPVVIFSYQESFKVYFYLLLSLIKLGIICNIVGTLFKSHSMSQLENHRMINALSLFTEVYLI